MSKKKQKKDRKENQHYVPRLYLRGFTNESGMMVCYDKVSGKTYPTTVEAAAQEPYFYEIPPGSFENKVNLPLNAVENGLGVVERNWSRLHAEMIRRADAGSLSVELTINYAFFVVIQWMRTRTFRDMIYQVAEGSTQAIADDLVALNFPVSSGVTVKLDKKVLPAMHFKKLFDWDATERMARDLERHIWVVGLNQTDHLFYTSDHPVVRRGNRKDEAGRPMVGVLDPGIEFALPLDSRHILLIFERTHFPDRRKHDNKSVILTPEQVRDYNGLQVMRSCQRVYCANNDFDVVREVCAAHPEVCDPNRPRVIFETTPIVPAGVGEDGKPRWKNNLFMTALE